MKKILLFAFTTLGFYYAAIAQQVYVNGTLSTGEFAEDGTQCISGYNFSETQHTPDFGNANSTSGFGSSGTNAIADDFIVPDGESWHITGTAIYAYQTGYTGTTSPITQYKFRIWDGDPASGTANIVFGDLTTNRLTSTYDALLYRMFNTIFFTPDYYSRRVWKVEGSADVTLEAGTYWIEWQTAAVGTHYCPPATVVGARGVEGWNALSHTTDNNKWALIQDAGIQGGSAPKKVNQDFPFEITYTNLLPISFLRFSGNIKNNQTILNWATGTELNNKGFYVERSADGKNFSSIGFVQGAGNSSVEKSYSYTDAKVNDVKSSTVYYRLKQMDVNGKITYSAILQLKTGDIIQWSIYPNPVTTNSWVQFNITEAVKVNLKVVASDGRIIQNIDKGTLQAGTYTIPVNMLNAAKGVYFIKLTTGDKTYSQTVTK